MRQRRFYEENSLRADSSTNGDSSTIRKLYEEKMTERRFYEEKSSASRQLYEGRQLYEETAPRGQMVESAGDPSRANIDAPWLLKTPPAL